MRYSRRLQLSMRWLPAVIPFAAALAAGCHGQVEQAGDGGGTSPTGGGGTTGGGPDGGVVVDPTPCTGPADKRMAVADQRILLLTKPQIVNTIAYLIDQTGGGRGRLERHVQRHDGCHAAFPAGGRRGFGPQHRQHRLVRESGEARHRLRHDRTSPP